MTITIAFNNATLIGAKEPEWANAEKTSIRLKGKFSHYESQGMTENDGYYVFLADPYHDNRSEENASHELTARFLQRDSQLRQNDSQHLTLLVYDDRGIHYSW